MNKSLKAIISALILIMTINAVPAYASEKPVWQSAITIQTDEEKKKDEQLVSELREKYYAGSFNIPVMAPETLKEYTPLYTAKMEINASLRDRTDEDTANKIVQIPKYTTVTIFDVMPDWVLTEYDGEIGYLLRKYLDDRSYITIDPANTPPYGVQLPKYVAHLTDTALIYNEPSTDSLAFKIPVEKGADIAILDFVDGFAKVIVWRNYGFIDAKLLENITMVSPTDEPLNATTPIAAFCSFYEHDLQKETNDSRCVNIKVSCIYMTKTIEPGESFDFNEQVGPYKKEKGYLAAPVLINESVQPGYGGGTCQSSSTLYNTLRQIPGVTILYRRPHGINSAPYLPIHQDAAVGNDSLNLKFRNDYEFAISIVATAEDGCLCIRVYKVD